MVSVKYRMQFDLSFNKVTLTIEGKWSLGELEQKEENRKYFNKTL